MSEIEIRGTPPNNPDREETDSGFAQNDRVFHEKRGPGTITGFFGEFVMCQFDSEPHGQHKYSHDKARRCLCFPDAAPKDFVAPAAAAPTSKKSKLKRKDRVEHASRGVGTITSVDADGEVTVKFDNGLHQHALITLAIIHILDLASKVPLTALLGCPAR